MTARAFIVGGTGQVGRAIALDLLTHGWEVTVAHRGTQEVPRELLAHGARVAILDREEPGSLARALGEGADALIDVVAFDERHADQLLEVQDHVGAFVVISTVSVYRELDERSRAGAGGRRIPEDLEPIDEAQPTVAPGAENYSTRKVALEQRLLERARPPVTLLRPGAIHGKGCRQPREWWFIKRMLDGRERIPLAFGGRSHLHTSSTENIAALARTALLHPERRILNAVDPVAPSVLEIGTLLSRHLGFRGELVPIDETMSPPPGVGSTPWSVPTSLVFDDRASLLLGYEPATTYAQALPAYCDWLVETASGVDWRQAFPAFARYRPDPFDYEAEDAFFTRSRPVG